MTATTAVLSTLAVVLASLGTRFAIWSRREARKTPAERRAEALRAVNGSRRS